MIRSLAVHRNTLEKRRRREGWDRLRAAVLGGDRDWDGWALVQYRRDGPTDITVSASYHVRDAADAHLLPDMARMHLSKRVLGG